MKSPLILLTSLGVSMFVAGVSALAFGASMSGSSLHVSGLGPFNGSWNSADYFFLGAALATLGSGLATGGYLGLRSDERD